MSGTPLEVTVDSLFDKLGLAARSRWMGRDRSLRLVPGVPCRCLAMNEGR